MPDRESIKIREILWPGYAARITKVRASIEAGSPASVAYYTTADTAVKMLRSGQIWLRSVMVMNDTSEVAHGLQSLVEVLQLEAGKTFLGALDQIHPGLAEKVCASFGKWAPHLQQEAFLMCVSEQAPTEQEHGRLSMWRAYGGQTGVALIFHAKTLFAEVEGSGIYIAPVRYYEKDGLADEFRSIVERIKTNLNFLKSISSQTLENYLFYTFFYSAICTKHPAFKEEQEWRIITVPTMKLGKHLTEEVEVIRGVPQIVQKLDLSIDGSLQAYGLTWETLIDRILIGPCADSPVVRRAIIKVLADAGVSDAEKKVFETGIPLRHG